MVVDIEYRRLQALIDEPLRRDRDVVEVAVASENVAAGMMAWRPREREGGKFSVLDRLSRRERGVHRGECGVPCAFDDRRCRVEGISAETRLDVTFVPVAQTPCRPGRRDRGRGILAIALAP